MIDGIKILNWNQSINQLVLVVIIKDSLRLLFNINARRDGSRKSCTLVWVTPRVLHSLGLLGIRPLWSGDVVLMMTVDWCSTHYDYLICKKFRSLLFPIDFIDWGVKGIRKHFVVCLGMGRFYCYSYNYIVIASLLQFSNGWFDTLIDGNVMFLYKSANLYLYRIDS